GGHAAIRETLHDGIRLPRAFRVAGFRTDIFDATDLASCRMYRSASEVWSGLAKNAVEGIGAPSRIIFFTTVLGAGQILPFLLCGLAAVGLLQGAALPIAVVAVFLSLYPRLVAAVRFRQPFVFALLHPFGVGMLLLLQWYALARYLLRRPSSWKGRAYETGLTGD
ncbi:MAG: glycosyl transferase, partial [Bryobacteraceae bacterium]|nr:glycosyl transferase [Bryobacteraceae bacterium]